MKLSKINLGKRLGALLICVVALVSMVSCQSNPEESIIKNNDFDKLIDQAQNQDTNSVGMDELVGKYDTYKTVLSDDKVGVTVNVDAKVDIPKAEKLSVMSVEQTPITQEQLDSIRKALVGDTLLYDGAVLSEQTKADIESEIAYYMSSIEDVKKSTDINTQKEIDDYCNETQAKIDALKVKYDSAPDKVVLDKYMSDGKIKSVSELYGAQPQIYELENEFCPEGSLFSAVGTFDGDYYLFKVLDTANWSNKIKFIRDSVGIHNNGGVIMADSPLWREGEDVQSSFVGDDGAPETGDPHPTDKVTLSLSDAVSKANELLKATGLDSFSYYEGDRYYEAVTYTYTDEENNRTTSNKIYRRDYYVLTYTRVIDNAPITPGAGKNSLSCYSGTDTNPTKKEWYTETITIKINDSGIVGFDFIGQLNLKEIVEESTALKSFDEIMATFEQMVLIANASNYGKKTIDIDRVTLGYALVSEQNSYDTGLLIPVWDFFGSSHIFDGDNEIYSSSGSLFTINAIDGSIIDRALGY